MQHSGEMGLKILESLRRADVPATEVELNDRDKSLHRIIDVGYG